MKNKTIVRQNKGEKQNVVIGPKGVPDAKKDRPNDRRSQKVKST
jgi:hypothetical protein